MSLKDFLGIGIATESNDYFENEDDKIFIRNEKGELVYLEGIEDDNH